MNDVQAILDAGADKVSLNSAAVKNPKILENISEEYGSERLVCAIDGNRVYVDSIDDAPDKNLTKVGNKYCWFDVLTHGGSKSTGMDAINWAKEVKELGVGEILPTRKTYDGSK
jgi:cyclase